MKLQNISTAPRDGTHVLLVRGGRTNAKDTETMENTDKRELCGTCRHRAESIERVKKWQERGGKGMCCDPAPRAECKDHEGYYRAVGTKYFCRDYCPSNDQTDPQKRSEA